jgi:hypothetical protein
MIRVNILIELRVPGLKAQENVLLQVAACSVAVKNRQLNSFKAFDLYTYLSTFIG